MILAALNFHLIINILLVILMIVCLLMGLIIMLQRPKQEGLGAAFGGDTMNELAGAKASDVMQKATGFFAVLFFVICLVLGVLWNQQNPTEKLALEKQDSEKTDDVAEQVQEQASDVAEQVQEQAGDVAEQVQEQASDVAEQAGEALQNVQKEASGVQDKLNDKVPPAP